MSIPPDLTPSCPVSIQQKRVLLLAAEDHVYHIQAVERFANFLSVHCRCNVSFAPQCLSEIQEQNSYCWLSSIIDHADYVLIITSKVWSNHSQRSWSRMKNKCGNILRAVPFVMCFIHYALSLYDLTLVFDCIVFFSKWFLIFWVFHLPYYIFKCIFKSSWSYLEIFPFKYVVAIHVH